MVCFMFLPEPVQEGKLEMPTYINDNKELG